MLVIDDDLDMLSIVSLILQDEGYQVETAADGQEALEAVERTKPDLILMDMKMPIMNGWQFAREFHARFDSKTPIVVLTAAEDAKKRAEQIGAVGWIGKPFALNTLVDTAERFVGGR